MAAPITRLYYEINNVTGFANGDHFETAAQVADYFTVANLHAMVGAAQFRDEDGQDRTPTQETLDRWADEVKAMRWHCVEDFEDEA